MKHLLTFASVICILSNVKSQDMSKDIQGTWKIKNNTYKSYTATHFTRLEVDSSSKITKSSVFGLYSIANGTCSETVVSATEKFSALIGKTNTFRITFKDTNQFILENVADENKKETWTRIDRKVATNAGSTPNWLVAESYKPPLYVLKDGKKNIKLNNVLEKGKYPFDMFPQEFITSVEVLKDEDAKALFGAAGKNGVVILTVVETEIANIIKQLKGAGLID